jgi:hypothetical protein
MITYHHLGIKGTEICRIWGADSSDYEEFYLLEYNAVYSVES